MAIALSDLNTLKRKHPPVLAVYGNGGVGKTSLAAEFPNPLYLYTEGEEPPVDVEMVAAKLENYGDLMDEKEGYIAQLFNSKHDFKTLIIDSLDGFERFVWEHTCLQNGGEKAGWSFIDSNDKGSPTAFGKGYLAADVYWDEYMAAVRAVAKELDMHVVQIIHSEAKKWEDPIVDSYLRYRPNLQERAVKKVKNKSDALLFMSKRTSIKQVEKGFGKKESKPDGMSGAQRVIYTDERAGFEAKSRLKMPPSIPYTPGNGFAELQKYFYTSVPVDEEEGGADE